MVYRAGKMPEAMKRDYEAVRPQLQKSHPDLFAGGVEKTAYGKVQEAHPYLTDIAESAGRGLKRGAVDLAGTPGTLAQWMNAGIDFATGGLAGLMGVDLPESKISEFGTPEDINEKLGLTYGKPRTTAGAYARNRSARWSRVLRCRNWARSARFPRVKRPPPPLIDC